MIRINQFSNLIVYNFKPAALAVQRFLSEISFDPGAQLSTPKVV